MAKQFEKKKMVINCLQENPDKKFTAEEIAKWIWDNYQADCEEKIRNSTATKVPVVDKGSLITALVAEINSDYSGYQKNDERLKTAEENPRKFYFSEQTSEEESQRETITTSNVSNDGQTEGLQKQEFSEHDLYPLLSQYLATEFLVHSKRIDEKKSKNKGKAGSNRWLFPDLVGLEDLGRDWQPTIKETNKESGDKKAQLWSFEVKLVLNRSNVREAFFQTVSNSSWANFGYLVASQISGGDTMRILQMLSSLHGIGVMRLNAESPTESDLVIPAREKNEVDWTSANHLAEENANFTDYIKLVRNFYKTDEINPTQWDAPILESD